MHVLTGMQRHRHSGRFAWLLLAGTTLALMAMRPAPPLVAQSERHRPQVGGIFPHLSIVSAHDPRYGC
jgi:hypothetical protein